MQMQLYQKIAISFLMFVPLLGCKKPEPTTEVIRPVRTFQVADEQPLADGYLPGRAKATQEVDLAFRVSGPLITLTVDIGDEVKQGDIVAQIDPRDFKVALLVTEADLAAMRSQLKAMKTGARPEEIVQMKAAIQTANAKLNTANANFARAVKLVKTGAVTQATYDKRKEVLETAKAELQQAQETLRIGERGARVEDIEAKEAQIQSLTATTEDAKNQLNYCDLRAPFAGKVVSKYVENFENVQAKQSIVRIVDMSKIEMVINIPESAISFIPYLKDVACTFDAFPENKIPATVKEIGAEATRSTRTYPVTLIIDQPKDGKVKILPGMAGRATGRVDLPDSIKKEGVEIPEAAVFDREGKQYVWLIKSADGKQGTVNLTSITSEKMSARGLRNVTGLKIGDIIATAGVHFLEDGQTVRITDKTVKTTTNGSKS